MSEQTFTVSGVARGGGGVQEDPAEMCERLPGHGQGQQASSIACEYKKTLRNVPHARTSTSRALREHG